MSTKNDLSLGSSLEENNRDTPQDLNSKGKTLLLIACIAFGAGVFLAMLLIPKPQNDKQSVRQSTISKIPPLKTTSTYETSKTRIAKSLDLPVLDKTWKEEPIQSNSLCYSQIENSDPNDSLIKLTDGKCFIKSVDFRDNPPVAPYGGNFYQDNWSTDDSPIEFSSFSLQGVIADGACGGVVNFIGYKNEEVRVVSEQRKINPCHPLGDDIKPPQPAKLEYTIFIANPVQLKNIAPRVK